MGGPSQASLMVALVQTEDAELWHDPDGRAYATIQKPDHREHHRIRSSFFRVWLAGRAYHELGISPGSETMQTALTTLEGIAIHDGDEHAVFTRLGELNGNIYLDLANGRWQAVEVTRAGWRVVDNPPIRFRRAMGMKPLPVPLRGGQLDQLHQLINVKDGDWSLFAGWLVQAANSRGPYPVLAIYGEHGSAKSSAARLLRAIIDPNLAPLRSPPREVRDLAIAATNSWVVVLDNLSSIPVWLSDALCVLSTGGGFATRTLYTDDEESIFSFRRPVIINGIAEVAERGDLIDRCVPVTLEVISDERRLTEDEVEAAFAAIHPMVLGALMDAVATALARVKDTKLTKKPRMADFTRWVVAAEPALGLPEGDFLRAYYRARAEAIETNIDTSTVGQWVRALAEKRVFAGTATELFDLADDKIRRASDWPKNARALSAELKRLAPALRTLGVGVEFKKESSRARRRLIFITSLETAGESASDASEPSAADSNYPPGSDATDELRTQADLFSDATFTGSQIRSDASDGSDARSRANSGVQPCSLCGKTEVCDDCVLEAFSDLCSQPGCQEEISMYDRDGRGWCEEHSRTEALG